eukprot:437120_1
MEIIYSYILPSLAIVRSYCVNTIIEVPSMSVTGIESVTPAFYLAIQNINENPYILPNYTLRLNPMDSSVFNQTDWYFSDEITRLYRQCQANPNEIKSPIILGPTWSEWNLYASSAFNGANLLHIGACATSKRLSTKQYSAFFRTVPNDYEQAQAIIALTEHFNLRKIGFISLKQIESEIEYIIRDHNNGSIEVDSFYYRDKYQIKLAAEYISQHKLFTTVLNVRGDHLYELFEELRKLNVLSPKYGFILCDVSWVENGTIEYYNLSEYLEGNIGIIPAIPAMFSEQQYAKIQMDGLTYYVSSNEINQLIQQQWNNFEEKDEKQLNFNKQIINNYFYYAYDSVYALAYALEKFDKKHDLHRLKNCDISYETQKILRNILVSDVNFVGVTGRVKFNENGDRIGGMYGFVEIENGTVKPFGAIMDDNVYIDYPTEIKSRTKHQSNIFTAVIVLVILILIAIASRIFAYFKSDKQSVSLNTNRQDDDEYSDSENLEESNSEDMMLTNTRSHTHRNSTDHSEIITKDIQIIKQQQHKP